MAQVRVPGGLWVPTYTPLWPSTTQAYNRGNFGTLDADEEETQFIGRVCLAGGAASTKTFGTSGSKVGWLLGGGSVQLVATATLRVGVKKAATIDLANGPPARATIGAAAF